jgi:DinB family
MQDDLASLFAFNRSANSKMLDACRKVTPEQYAAGPAPGWAAIRSTVYHLATVTDVRVRTLARDQLRSAGAGARVANPRRPRKSSNPAANCFHNQRRDLSLRNSRGDWTPLELFLAGENGWDGGLSLAFNNFKCT